jgi:hypothetical protein
MDCPLPHARYALGFLIQSNSEKNSENFSAHRRGNPTEINQSDSGISHGQKSTRKKKLLLVRVVF